MKISPTHIAIATALVLSPLWSQAGTVADAAKLKSTLTPLGGERAGNKEGTIPVWDGSFPKVPSSYKSGDPRPNPFPGEKPVLTISAANMAQYADKLSEATKALLKKHASYRLDVYPSHRTGVAPQYVYDNTAKNVTRAKLVDGGYGVEGALGGVPFPVTQNPYEAIWNHRLAWTGASTSTRIGGYVLMDGRRSIASMGSLSLRMPYYDQDMTPEKFEGYYLMTKWVNTAPAYKVGEAILFHESLNEKKPRNVWQYLVGQRRVRKAPSVAYDTPDSVMSGTSFFDEAFMLLGPIDKHELKMIGKKEMYIPYNNTASVAAGVDDLYTPNHLNPSHVRWELHRVWEIEATLKSGQRHVVPKRRYYLDEDTWQIIMSDGWDAKGELWHGGFTLTYFAGDLPALVGNVMWGLYDLHTNNYMMASVGNGQPMFLQVNSPAQPASFFAPETLASEGMR